MPAPRTLALALFLAATTLSLTATATATATAGESTVTGTGFELSASVPSTSKAGAPVELTLVLIPTAGRKINQEFPLSIAIAAPSDVKVPRAKLGRADASKLSEARAVFPIALPPSTAGERTISLDVRFAVCSDRACEPQRESISVALQVH